jgi:CheY-like chemotaxis protein
MINTILSGKKILIVEDDMSSRLYLNKILEKTGADILVASDGLEAVKVALENPDTDIILMDIQLPFLDGYGAAKKIREAGMKAIIVAQTAYGLSGDMENIIASGFDDYIIKPIYAAYLIEKISLLLKKK